MCVLHVQPFSIQTGHIAQQPPVAGGSRVGEAAETLSGASGHMEQGCLNRWFWSLDLNFPICEGKVMLPVLWTSQGCFPGLSKSSTLSTAVFRALILRHDEIGL